MIHFEPIKYISHLLIKLFCIAQLSPFYFILKKDEAINEQNSISNQLWKLYFDGSSSKEGSGAGVVLISPTDQVITLSFKLQFLTTNNTAE